MQSNEKAEEEKDLGEKDCPLTTGEWITFLTAQSRAKLGYIITAVAVILAAYTATSFEEVGHLYKLIFVIVFYSTIILIFYVGIIVIKKSSESDRIVKKIISGELSDSNEIRRQWERKRK